MVAVIDQFPLGLAAVAVPRTTVPSITKSTCNPAAVVPVKVGVLTFVILSMFDAPLSLAAARSGVEFGVVSGFPEFETLTVTVVVLFNPWASETW